MSVRSRGTILNHGSRGFADACCRCFLKRYLSFVNRDKRCLYEVLEVSEDASRAKIRDAYVAKTKQIHPDMNISDPDLHDRFVELNEAYSILRDSAKRSHYDELRRNPVRVRQRDVQASRENPFGTQRYRPGTEGHYNPNHEAFYNSNPYTANNFKNYEFSRVEFKHEQKPDNKIVIGIVIACMFVGAGFSFAHINWLTKRVKNHGEEVNLKNGNFYESVREKARMNGPHKQLQLLASSKETILSSSEINSLPENPT